jgi:hypothetical protein
MASASDRRPDRSERDRSAIDPADKPDGLGGPGARGGPGGRADRLGPVALMRLEKDDGRALILYTRDGRA